MLTVFGSMQEPQIKKLSNKVSSLIAAGEVIIRPASVVKELVENSIDSKANNIDIWLENGGKNLIVIKDDGHGMSFNNLKICTQKHTTSKIRDNLNEINSFGFRGEALFSIVSVAKTTISSRHHLAKEAYCIYNTYDTEQKINSIIFDKGTKIEVKDLFFSLPARLKFLKSDKVEAEYCLSIIKQLAIVNPNINFCCYIDQKKVFEVRTHHDVGSDTRLKNRLQDVIGKKHVDNAIYVQANAEDIKVTGFIGDPLHNRAGRDMQFFFVNGRRIQDAVFYSALKIGYSDLIPPNRHPIGILFIEISNHLIDVNVHPAKTELRFRDPNALKFLIVQAIKAGLAEDDSTSSFDRTIEATDIETAKFRSSNHKLSLHKHPPPHMQEKKQQLDLVYMSSYSKFGIQKNLLLQEPNVDTFGRQDNVMMNNFPLGVAVAQIDKTFIVSISQDGMFVIDQHAAHERILYEQLKTQIAEKKFLITQHFLSPITVVLDTMQEYEMLEKNIDALSQVGLIYSLSKEQSVIVKAVPSIIANNCNAAALIQKIAKDYVELKDQQHIVDLVDYVLKTFSCHRSIRANRILSVEEMNQLLRKIENTQYAKQCNHGRPTYVKFSVNQIAKWFER